MIIKAKIKTNAKENSIEKQADGSYLIKTTASPIEGKANQAIKKQLAKHLGVTQSEIVLKAGQTSKNKVFSVGG